MALLSDAPDSPATFPLGGRPIAQSIRGRLLLAITGLMALVLVSQAVFLVLFGYRHLRGEVILQAKSFSRLAATAIGRSFERDFEVDHESFLRTLTATSKLEDDLLGLALYEADSGRALYSWTLCSDASRSDAERQEILRLRPLDSQPPPDAR
ncbi:MAG: hypothetical protein AAF725_26190, partial [Acidobacteriota bacterium]